MKALGSHERISVHCSFLSPNPLLLPKKEKKKKNQFSLTNQTHRESETHKTENHQMGQTPYLVIILRLNELRSFGGESSLLIGSETIPRAKSIRRTRESTKSMNNTSVIVDHFFPCNRLYLPFAIVKTLRKKTQNPKLIEQWIKKDLVASLPRLSVFWLTWI